MKSIKKFLLCLIASFFIVSTISYAISENEELNWYIVNRSNKETPEIQKGVLENLKNTKSFFIGDSFKKDLFLTFDLGYENGNTVKILDSLKEKNVKAAFFVVKSYILQNKDIINRMVKEGHLVCNHSVNHKSMAGILNDASFNKEFLDTELAFKEVTGKEMPKYFRPPMGKYSFNSLVKTNNLGYKTIFWSFAYKDWLVDSQPNPEASLKKIKSSMHNGCILLLHAVSTTNSEILNTLIDDLKADGYSFKSLDDLPQTMVLTGDDKLQNTFDFFRIFK